MFDDHEVFLKSVRLFFTVSVLNGKWRKTPKIREFESVQNFVSASDSSRNCIIA